MPRKRKHKNHFKTCRRCRQHFRGSKYAKLCWECDKRAVTKIEKGENMKDGELKKLIEKRLRNFKPEDRVF